jgi:hypothetical protein
MRLLNYLELFVHRQSGDDAAFERGVAVVLAFGRDLFDSLERAVFELQKSGWSVDDVTVFKTDVRFEQISGRDRLRNMYNRAIAEGIDWTVDPAGVAPERAAVSAL